MWSLNPTLPDDPALICLLIMCVMSRFLKDLAVMTEEALMVSVRAHYWGYVECLFVLIMIGCPCSLTTAQGVNLNMHIPLLAA